jgi:ATP-binding cassette subfamily C (CFTR/MRP) protein 4
LDALVRGDAGKAYTWAGVLSAINIIQVFIHHVLFFFTMRLGVNWKQSVISLIYSRLFYLNSSSLTGSSKSGKLGTGKLVNMISNDVYKYEEFSVFGFFTWVSLLDLVAILILLIFSLNIAAGFAGAGMSLLFIPIQVYIAKQFAVKRRATGAATDQRVRFISEVIDGVSTVKSYAWENPFYALIGSFRIKEMSSIRKAQHLRSVNLALYYFTPPVAAFATFSVYWATGGELRLPTVFSTTALLLQLRQSIGRHWTRGIETGAEALSSTNRIEEFLHITEAQVEDDVDSADAALVQSVYNSSFSDGDLNGDRKGSKEDDMNEDGQTNLDSSVVDKGQASRSPAYSQNEGTLFQPGSEIVKVRKSAYQYGAAVAHDQGSESTASTPTTILSDIEFSLHAGELVMVVGSVGSGKSSLLSAILGEMTEVNAYEGSRGRDGSASTETTDSTAGSDGVNSSVNVARGVSFAFCAQRPWILAGSARANIVLSGKEGKTPRDTKNHNGKHVNHSEQAAGSASAGSCNMPLTSFDDFKNPEEIDVPLYELAIESTRIVQDLNEWPDIDETEIGERGISISGGQKARLALARAVYSNADAYVLDDVLSAVDAQVGSAIFFDCILQTLRGRGKGVILATHQLQYLKHADKIIVLEKDGRQSFYGTYTELYDRSAEFPHLSVGSHGEGSASSSHSDLVSMAGGGTPDSRKKVKAVQQGSKDISVKEKCLPGLSYRSNKNGVIQPDGPNSSKFGDTGTTKFLGQSGKVLASESAKKGSSMGVQAEDRVLGNVSKSQVLSYLFAGGRFQGMYAISLAVLSQGLAMITEYWLRWWAGEKYGDQSRVFYVWVLGLLTFACIFMGLYRALQWYSFTRAAGNSLHSKALWAVLHSPLYFFVANPTGRILNRFSRDQSIVDETLPFVMFDFIQTFLFAVAAIILSCVAIPYILILVVPLAYTFWIVRQKYIVCQREIKRIDATSKSPIYSDFSATLEGLETLRAYDLKQKATASFERQVDRNSRAWFSFLMVSRWIGVRLDAESTVVVVFVAFLSVVLRNSIDVGLIGFALTYALSLSGLLQWCARQSAEVEAHLTSVERISTYTELPPEPGYSTTLEAFQQAERHHRHFSLVEEADSTQATAEAVLELKSHVKETPKNAGGGDVEVDSLYVTYRHDLDPILKGVSMKIPAGAKVGICGRTGSGKSSTLLALLRLNIVTAGDILLDGESLLDKDLETARSEISTIPQDPHLFSGTVRFNLDPFGVYTDAEIWGALEDAHIKDHISGDGGLSTVVEESGKNFSVGQRQLLSMARAILRRSRVVLMDEVTASIDYKTDRLIQQTIRESPAMRDATIITIAHRLRTIADSNVIVVVRGGVVVEMETPLSLLERDGSEFRALAVESGEYDEILRLAKGETLITRNDDSSSSIAQ